MSVKNKRNYQPNNINKSNICGVAIIKAVDGSGKIYKPLKTTMINAKDLKDAIYQRRINPKRIEEIIANFKLALVNPLKVSLREDGTYRIIDGQHTYTVLVILFGEDIDITCVVVDTFDENKSQEQVEAETFAHQQDFTKALTADDKFKASYIACESRETTITKICANRGYRLKCLSKAILSEDYTKMTEINCTNELTKIFDIDGTGKVLDRTLNVLFNAYKNQNKDALCGKFVSGVAEFIKKYSYHSNYKDEQLIKALKNYVKDPKELISLSAQASARSKTTNALILTVQDCLIDNLLGKYNYKKQLNNKIM